LCFSTGRHQVGLGSAGRTLMRRTAVPLLVWGPRAEVSADRYRRLVVGIDGARPHPGLVAAAGSVARRLGLEVTFTQVISPSDPHPGGHASLHAGDVHETAFLHRVMETACCPGSSYDMLHAPRAGEGLLRFVGHDPATITMVGAPTGGSHHHLRPAGAVARAVVRRSSGPVLLVPATLTPA
jgi:nucleotide-binding universal stress UspA family protein